MTDHDSAGTAAELKEMERALEPFMGGCDRAFIRMAAQAAIGTTTALRKQLDETRRECDELNRSIFGLYDTCAKYRAANALMATALRDVQSWVKSYVEPKGIFASGQVLLTIERALAPTSPSPGLRDAVIEECAKFVIDWMDDAGFPQEDIEALNAAMRALSRPVSEREDGQ